MQNKKIQYLLLSVLFLLFGTAIYVFLNPDIYFFHRFLPETTTDFSDSLFGIRYFLRCYGADFCWAVSFTFIIQIIMQFRKQQLFWLLFCPVLGILVEIFQALHWMYGTYDISDIIIYFSGTVTAMIIIRIWR